MQSSKQGSALITVMIVLFIISLAAGGFYAFSTNAVYQVHGMADAIRARAIAEAGANKVVNQLVADYTQRNGSFSPESFGDGTYEVSLVNTDGRCLMTSVGTYGRATALVGVDIRDAKRENQPPSWRDYAVFANGDLTLNGTPVIDGDMHTNNGWALNGGYDFVTAMITALSFKGDPPPADKVGIWQLVPFPELSDPDFQALMADAESRGKLLWLEQPGKKAVEIKSDWNPTAEIIIINDDLVFIGGPEVTINGLVYVNGHVTVNGSSELNVTGALLARDDITFNGGAGIFTHDPASSGAGGTGDADVDAEVKVYAWWRGGG